MTNTTSKHPKKNKRRVVILGSGYGGAYCAHTLEKRLKDQPVEILLIDRNNYFVFTPLLVEAGTGSLEPRHAVISIRSFIKKTKFRMAEATAVNTDKKTVTYRVPDSDRDEEVHYDHLVFALGSVTRLPEIPGLREFGFEMKSLADAVALRDRAIRMLERADAETDPEKKRAMLHFVVVGGNFSGVEVAGEFHVFMRKAAQLYQNVDPKECHTTLVELSNRILSAVDEDLSDYALTEMKKRGMKVYLETSLEKIDERHVTLSNGKKLTANTMIWCAGIAPNPLIEEIGLPVDERGYIQCERDLSVKGFDDVWAIGDCAVNMDANGKPYPATAQHAVREGIHLAKNIDLVFQGNTPKPCDILNLGSLAALGCRTGVAKIFGIKLSGFAAWFLWRTVYLMKMPVWSRRARVALDWTMDLIFSRDYVQLGVHRTGTKTSGSSSRTRKS